MFFKKKKAIICGHETKVKGKVTAPHLNNSWVKTKMPNPPQYCLNCIGKMAIVCALCGKPIFIGDVITLPFPNDKTKFKLKEHAVMYDKKRIGVVGCARETCADSGALYCGNWMPDPDNIGKGHVKKWGS